MVKGKTLSELAAEIEDRAPRVQDFHAPNGKIHAATDVTTVPASEDGQHEAHEIKRPVFFVDRPTSAGGELAIAPSARFHSQVSSALKIPKAYYDRMAETEPELLAENTNTWLHRAPSDTHLLRTFSNGESRQSTGRAYLGRRYQPIDAGDMLAATLPVVAEMARERDFPSEVLSSQLTEENLFLQLAFPRLTRDVPGRVGDAVRAGVIIRTNETGSGVAAVQTLIFRLWCTNGCASPHVEKRRHVGVSHNVEIAGEVDYSRRTAQLTASAIQSQMRDALLSAATEARFEQSLAQLGGAVEDTMSDANPEGVVELLKKDYSVSDSDGRGILREMIKADDWSRYGLVQAVTAQANSQENYETAIELEQLGGKLLDAGDTREWKQITTVAADAA